MLNQNGRGYKITYHIVEWNTLHEWEAALNEWVGKDWRVDNHKINGNNFQGCTVFSKTEVVRVPLLDASIDTREIYRVVNSPEMYDLKQEPVNNAEKACRMICDRIKQVCAPDPDPLTLEND